MTRNTILAAIGLALAGLAGSAQAEIVLHDIFDVNLSEFVPCANGGAGELVEVTGPLHQLVFVTINGNNASFHFHSQPQGLGAVGLTTGDVYRANGVVQAHSKTSMQNDQFTARVIQNYRFVGPGPGNDFVLRVDYQIVQSASGVASHLYDNISFTCD